MKYAISFLALLLSINLLAQWTTDTAVNTPAAENDALETHAIGTSDGQTYIVFWRVVPAPVNIELRLQVLDASGNRQLGPDGILVTENISMSTFTLVGSVNIDAEDNLYIGITSSGDAVGHVFKMDINGNHLWGSDGVSFSEGYSVKVLPLSSGEAIVSWFPYGQGLMQKYDADGNALWPAPQPVVSGTSSTAPADMFELSDGGYVVVFHVLSFGINSTLYAQRYDGDGVAQWASPTQLSNKSTAFIANYSGTQDGDYVYYGYSAATGLRFDSFLQKIDPDGTLPWGINGMDFDVNETNYEINTLVAHASDAEYVWAICTYTDPSQSEIGEYVQKFDKETGVRQFTDNAKMLFPISEDHHQHAGALHLADDRPIFLIKAGFDNSVTPTTLNAVLLDANGDFIWPEVSKPVATYEASKTDIYLAKPVNGQAVAVWMEEKSMGELIYAQNFTYEVINKTQDVVQNLTMKVYPNPAETTVHFEFDSPVKTAVSLTVYDHAGKLVLVSKQNIHLGNNRIEIDVDHLPQGNYTCRMNGENKGLDWLGNFLVVE